MKDTTYEDQSPWAVFLVFLYLGLTSFGGPAAHLACFREELVVRRRWLAERSYAELVALCQLLPGPTSSQVGIALGLARCGYSGALAAWAGFTLPSGIALTLLALGVARLDSSLPCSVLHGLKVVTVAIVAQATWGMARNLCPDGPRASIMAAAACLAFWAPAGQGWTIALGALLGLIIRSAPPAASRAPLPLALRPRDGLLWLTLLLSLGVALPWLGARFPSQALSMVKGFFGAGSMVFGGGHVVLPLLQAVVVPSGWVRQDAFLAGYGATQAMPGPLFTFAAFLGASMRYPPSGWLGSLICLLAIFTPSFLLVLGALPFWEALCRSARAQAALSGVQAAVVGLLLACLYQPVWTSAIHRPLDLALALAALLALQRSVPPWLVVLSCGVIAGGLNLGSDGGGAGLAALLRQAAP